MIYFPFTKITDSSEAMVAPGAAINAEGLALVRANNAQASGVMPSTGTGADKFVGFSIAGTSAAPFAEGYTNKQETFIVPAGGTVNLQFTPVAGQVFIFDKTASAVDADAVVTGKAVSGLSVGNQVVITYKYPLTVTQARALVGDIQPGGYVGAYVGQIGVAKRGVIYTGEFDTSKNWAAATAVKMAAGGQLTDQSGAGVAINATIIAAPGAEVPYLGLEFTAP